MRKLISTLFISLDGVVESPDKFVRPEMYADFPEEVDTALSEQDAVLMGRKIYDEWSVFWPASDIEPFATFINTTPKFVVSSTLREANWQSSTLISHDVAGAIANLKVLCEQHLKSRYRIEVIDLLEHPHLARGNQIVAIPTLEIKLPKEVRKIIGDLSDTDRVLVGLALQQVV